MKAVLCGKSTIAFMLMAEFAKSPRPPTPPGTRTRGGEEMADRLEMARYYHQYQDAAIKCSRAKQELDKIEKLLQTMPDPDTLDDLLAKKAAAQARYDELKEALADAESLAMTGQPRQTMKAAQEVQWFTPWGTRITKQ